MSDRRLDKTILFSTGWVSVAKLTGPYINLFPVMQIPIRGLYAIADNNTIPNHLFIKSIQQAMIGGAKIIQYRDKNSDKERRKNQARALYRLCQKYQIGLIINDDVRLAQKVSANGVHLGKDDIEVSTARAILGPDAIIGVSCYNQLSLAQQAIEEGATYIAFGSFFSSSTKPDAVSCSVDVLRQAREMFDCPIVAIGGITPDNGSELIAAGADCLAVVDGLFGQTDVIATAQRYADLWAVDK
jgi:thiamine-phosphate pyrophosphorylase